MTEHTKYYWDFDRNKPYKHPTPLQNVMMSVPDGLEFGKPYSMNSSPGPNESLIKRVRKNQEKLKEDRKKYPVYTGVLKYFPDALMELSRVSLLGNKQHHADEPLHWDRNKSSDHLDALTRHLLEADELDDDNILHLAKVAWRALAALQEKLEKDNQVL